MSNLVVFSSLLKFCCTKILQRTNC